MRILKSVMIPTALLLTAAFGLQAQEIFDTVRNKDLPKVKALVEKDSSLLKARDGAGNTPLHHAALIGSAEIAEFLLSEGADINAQNAQKNTPLHEAVQKNSESIAGLLIEKGADLNLTDINNQTPLHRAAGLNRKEMGEMLIAKGASIDPRDVWQRTPFLLVARQNGNIEFGKLLLKKGADINVKDRDNQMALNLAAWKGFNDFIDFLLDNGAEYDTSRGGDRLMLSSAAGCGSLRLFQAVLDREKTLLSDDSFAKSIMRAAVKGGSTEIVNLLLAGNISLDDIADRFGWTPLHLAAANGRAAMVRFLAARKFDINKRTLSGKSAYNIAAENNQSEVLKAIKELSGDAGPKRFPSLTGPYLGQTPPPAGPALFAPDIVSSVDGDDNHGSMTISPDGGEIYWNHRRKIWTTRLRDGRWTKPEMVSLGETPSEMDDNPFITPDGKKMYFTSTRPGAVSQGKENIWVAERASSGWSEPRPVSPEVNAMKLHWGISVSAAGNLYFGGTGQDGYGGGDIYCSKLVNGVYAQPANLGPEINGKDLDHCPYIAPDESYLIFSRFGEEESGFYISFRNKAGKWLPAKKLYEGLEGVCPLISPDGKYFFFNSDGIYWMDANIIKESRLNETNIR